MLINLTHQPHMFMNDTNDHPPQAGCLSAYVCPSKMGHPIGLLLCLWQTGNAASGFALLGVWAGCWGARELAKSLKVAALGQDCTPWSAATYGQFAAACTEGGRIQCRCQKIWFQAVMMIIGVVAYSGQITLHWLDCAKDSAEPSSNHRRCWDVNVIQQSSAAVPLQRCYSC